MRAQFLALSFIAATAAGSAVVQPGMVSEALVSQALAQQAAPAVQTFLNNTEIMALVDKAKADRKGDAPLVAEPILLLAPYKAMLEYRPSTAPAALHEKDAELMVVLDGTGTIVTGGKIVSEERVNAANTRGPAIDGGKSQAVVKGDMLIVPANTPHQVIPTAGAPIVLMTLHVPSTVADWP
jgi:mannose-6-phosphate isomerase-like protein (cupin superfamily)